MRRPICAVLILALALGACARIRDSRINPFNWFGRAERVERVEAAGPAAPVDGRVLVGDVTDVTLERMAGGVILRATGVAPTQGYWDAALVEVPVEDEGALVYDFRVAQPPTPQDVSTPRSREITVAVFLTNQRLETVRSITVQGANSGRSARR